MSTLRFLSTLHSLSALKRSFDRSGEWILDGDSIDEGNGRRNQRNGGVALEVNDCHYRMEAGGLREALLTCCHTDSIAVKENECRRVLASTLHSLFALKRSVDLSGE